MICGFGQNQVVQGLHEKLGTRIWQLWTIKSHWR